ncbi:hypothetical protein ACHAWF_006520 [Thalassiosira exigua]
MVLPKLALLTALLLSTELAGAFRSLPPPLHASKPVQRAASRGRAELPLQATPSPDLDLDVGSSRRSFLSELTAGLVTCAAAGVFRPKTAAAAADELVDVYFGCGCFWHVQHEFAEAERRILGRSDAELTARSRYAGGKAGALDGKVCYHNFNRVSDYGSLGHVEVVSLRIPALSYREFAVEYTKLFGKNGYRPDQMGVLPGQRIPQPRGVSGGRQGGLLPEAARGGVEAERGQARLRGGTGQRRRHPSARVRDGFGKVRAVRGGAVPPVPRRVRTGGELPAILQ